MPPLQATERALALAGYLNMPGRNACQRGAPWGRTEPDVPPPSFACTPADPVTTEDDIATAAPVGWTTGAIATAGAGTPPAEVCKVVALLASSKCVQTGLPRSSAGAFAFAALHAPSTGSVKASSRTKVRIVSPCEYRGCDTCMDAASVAEVAMIGPAIVSGFARSRMCRLTHCSMGPAERMRAEACTDWARLLRPPCGTSR